jgi:methionyl-tRNA formyltransferase
MRLVLMGTGPFAVPSFETLRCDGHEIACVITRPEVQAVSKKGPPPSPVRLWAVEHGLEHLSPESINSEGAIELVKSMSPDLLVVCDYGQILSNQALETARWGGINLHGSLLPRHRGAAPVQWSILSGDEIAGVSVIHMTPGLDAGPVIRYDSTPIDPRENAGELEQRLSQLGVETVRQSLLLLETSNGSTGNPQDKSLTTKAPRLSKADGQIQCEYPVRLLDRQLRGLQPWPGCFCEFESSAGNRFRVIVQKGAPIECDIGSHSVGSVLFEKDCADGFRLDGDITPELSLVCRDGLFVVETIQVAGKKSMSAEEFVRGYSKNGPYRVVSATTSTTLLETMIKREPAS